MIVHVECATPKDMRWLKNMIAEFPGVAVLTDIGIEVKDRRKFDRWLDAANAIVTFDDSKEED